MEKHRGVLECQVSRASAQVRWFKGRVELQPGPKYEVVSDGLYRKLVINDVQPEDEDTYTCDAGDVKTSAQFFVEGMEKGVASAPGFVGCVWFLWLALEVLEAATSERSLPGDTQAAVGGC